MSPTGRAATAPTTAVDAGHIAARARPRGAQGVDDAALRLALFAAFAAFGAYHWAKLVAAPSAGAIAATVAAATGCAAALALLDRSALSRRAVVGFAVLAVLISFAAGLVANGIAPRLLLPSGWGDLADQLDRALLGVQTVDWPYDGPDDWIRTTILLGAPLLLTTAAALAFWPAPAEMRRPLRGAGLIVLIALYAIAVTTNSPGRPLLLGVLLLALIAAWLWLPRRSGRERLTGVAVVGAIGLLALPLAIALDGDRPWFDYRSWSPFGTDAGVTFAWDHSYGPLDWPRQGTTLLTVRSDDPHYWKTETLNSFDGVRWYRAETYAESDVALELPFDAGDGPGVGPWRYGEPNPAWDDEAHFTVRSLSTDLLVGTGLTYDVDGAAAATSADGTTQLLETLGRGDSYTVRAYQPDPTPITMAGAPRGYPEWVKRYTEIALPPAGADPGAGVRTVVVPPRGNRASAAERAKVAAQLASSAYSRAYDLATDLTGGSTSVYDAVATIDSHLRDSYRYSEQVPEHAYPLESFLFEDRQGYCQQFSGAMALMLRMVGIPARVAAGFSPGTLNRKTGEYRVRDLDAHSWVEVYFSGIGWVTFDPTPRATDSAGGGAPAATGASGAAGEVRLDTGDPGPAAADGGAGAAGTANAAARAAGVASAGDGLPIAVVTLGVVLAALALAGTLAFALRVRHTRALDRERLTAAEIAELHHALHRLGWSVSPATTLLELERQLATAAGPRAAAYARALRDSRFDSRGGPPPGPADRRALRRALARAEGPLGPLRALIAIPPGGPS